MAILSFHLCIFRTGTRGDKFPKRERKMTSRDEKARRGLEQPVGR